jgi:hypothetical protein
MLQMLQGKVTFSIEKCMQISARFRVHANLFWDFWEKYLFGVGSTIWAFRLVGRVNCVAIWTFDSHHFIEVFVYYLHLLFLSSFLLSTFEEECANHSAAIVIPMNMNEKIATICHASVPANFSNTSNNSDGFKSIRS